MDWLSIKEFLLDTAKYFIAICIILFIITYVFSITQVVGDSMNPGLQDGEVLILNKFKYRISDVKRGDIISLKYSDGKYLIKRVIGLPGDKIDIIDSKLYINDKLYEEDYLKENMTYADYHLSSLNIQTIPEGYYFVLGDNRVNSVDSREIGLIKKSDINGKVSFRFWPLNKVKFL